MRIAFLIAGFALAALIAAAIRYLPDWFAEAEEPPPAVVAEPRADPQSQTEPLLLPSAEILAPQPEIELPALDSSDAFVLERVSGFGFPDSWLDRDDLIRRLAVVIDNAAQGGYPSRQLGFLAPTGRFQIIERGGRMFIDPVSYERYDVYLDTLERIDPQTLANSLLLFEPLVVTGLRELGNQQPMVTQIHMAISKITELPLLAEEVELVQPAVFYHYADPQLETLSSLQKQVLRMGPHNVQRLQNYLRAFQIAIAVNDPSG
ncbi:MAG: DUF3014 domain-containing protein [Gammaproteobacteria bacterium]|nr:DUF3014 domain-containing protein [Gammaproteobacteria bacterium]